MTKSALNELIINLTDVDVQIGNGINKVKEAVKTSGKSLSKAETKELLKAFDQAKALMDRLKEKRTAFKELRKSFKSSAKKDK